MKISDVSVDLMVDYLRIDDASETEKNEIGIMMESAKSYIKSYTGLSVGEMDKIEELTQALFILVADMFDNRNLYIEGKSSNINNSVKEILGMHSVNLL